MFHRIAQYPLISAGGRAYRPRAYCEPRRDGMWDGWLVFFPVTGGAAIAPDRETSQPSLTAVTHWADGLSDVYLRGALDRALRIADQPPILATLARAEYEALADAEALETKAELERLTATADDVASAAHEQAARDARAAAADTRRRRRRTERQKKHTK